MTKTMIMLGRMEGIYVPCRCLSRHHTLCYRNQIFLSFLSKNEISPQGRQLLCFHCFLRRCFLLLSSASFLSLFTYLLRQHEVMDWIIEMVHECGTVKSTSIVPTTPSAVSLCILQMQRLLVIFATQHYRNEVFWVEFSNFFHIIKHLFPFKPPVVHWNKVSNIV